MHKNLLLVWLMLCSLSMHSQLPNDTLHINFGTSSLGSDVIQALRFNTSSEFDSINSVLRINPNEEFQLTVVNNDTVDHNLGILPLDAFGPTISHLSSQVIAILQSTSERGMVLGASMMLRVGYDDLQHFEWNLNEWDTLRTEIAASQMPVDFAAPYEPRQFTINDRVFPNTLEDSTAYVAVDLNQEVYISIVNHGYMEQVLHFHGFHIEMIQSSYHNERVGWMKDTVPLRSGECVIVKLVANQPGVYPVHAHNLIAVTNAGFYPGGMITQINVTE